jgi:hypothetical protein
MVSFSKVFYLPSSFYSRPCSFIHLFIVLQDIEHLLVQLLTHRYLAEEYHQTSYQVLAYLAPGQLAARLTHHQTRESVTANANLKLEFYFVKGASKAKAKDKGKAKDNGKKKDANGSKSSIPKKRRSSGGNKDEEEGGSDLDSISFDEDDEDEDDDQAQYNRPPPKRGPIKPSKNAAAAQKASDEYEEIDIYASDLQDSDSEVTYDWSHSMRDEPRAKRRRKSSDVGATQSGYKMNIVKEGNHEVMVLSSD